MKVTFTIGSGLCMKCHMPTTSAHTIEECVSALASMRIALMRTPAWIHALCEDSMHGCGIREALDNEPVLSDVYIAPGLHADNPSGSNFI